MIKKCVFYPALLLILTGCASSPDTIGGYQSPARALLGIWRMADGSGEVAFSDDGSYRFSNPDGSGGRAEYRVLEEDLEKRTILTLIRLQEFDGEPVEEEVELKIEGRFAPNYRQFVGALVDEEGLATGPFRMERDEQ